MKKSTKIMLSVIGSVLAVCILITAAASINSKIKQNGGESETENTYVSSSGALQQTTAEQPAPISELIIGNWRDSANMSGYEFFPGGRVTVTYVNLTVPIVNMPINGQANGTYTVDGDKVTVKFSIYSGTITKNFTAKAENNTLTLRDNEDGDVATYEKAASASESTTAERETNASPASDILGGWINSDKTVSYSFFDNGKMKVSLKNAALPEESEKSVSGDYDGVYMAAAGALTIQFTVNGKKITRVYEYNLSNSSMSLKLPTGETEIFVRESNRFTAQREILGKWRDSSGMSGYNFREDGTVDITYVNFTVPVVNMPINGTLPGTYRFDGDKLVVSFSVYSRTVTDNFKYSVSGSSLTLKNTVDGRITVLSRAK